MTIYLIILQLALVLAALLVSWEDNLFLFYRSTHRLVHVL
jgi:hypothetical protein